MMLGDMERKNGGLFLARVTGVISANNSINAQYKNVYG